MNRVTFLFLKFSDFKCKCSCTLYFSNFSVVAVNFDPAVSRKLRDFTLIGGILCGEDLTAAGVLKALLRAGIRVPEETAVVGYDNSTYARLCEPELTSVDNKPEQVALLCVQLLQSRIEHGEDYSSVTLQPELVQRQSS